MWLDLQVQRRLQAAGQDFVLDVSLQCTQRQVVLFGPSGAGKSLTLKAVAGLLRPGQGRHRLLHGQQGGGERQQRSQQTEHRGQGPCPALRRARPGVRPSRRGAGGAVLGRGGHRHGCPM